MLFQRVKYMETISTSRNRVFASTEVQRNWFHPIGETRVVSSGLYPDLLLPLSWPARRNSYARPPCSLMPPQNPPHMLLRGAAVRVVQGARWRSCAAAGWKVQMARGGWIAYLNFLQTLLNKWVSKISGEAILALAQLRYASHLHKSSKKAKH